jgi:hypothetical protein
MRLLLRSTAMLGFLEVLNSGGSDAREIASKFGLNLDFANQDNEFISMDDFAKMLEYAARAKNLPCLGLNMSPYHDISILGPAFVGNQQFAHSTSSGRVRSETY